MEPSGSSVPYTRETLREAVRFVLNGQLSVSQAVKKYVTIPRRTLQNHVKLARDNLQPNEDGTYGEITTIPIKKGPATALTAEIENKIVCFIEDTYHMGIPRCKGRLAIDVQEYLNRNEIDIKSFIDRKPGRGYLHKFRLDSQGNRSFLMTAPDVKCFQDREILVPEWIGKVKGYVMGVQGQMIQDKSMVFIIEAQIFLTYTNPSRQLCFLVIYDGTGQVVKWIIVTDGTVLGEDIALSGDYDILFLRSEIGSLNSTVVKNAMICIKRHLNEKGETGYPLILMDMFLSAHYDLYVWDYCKQNFLLTIAIPKCICVSIRIFNMGPMRKYASYMLFLMQTRFINLKLEMTEFNYVCMHRGVLDVVVSKAAFKEILGKLKVASFAKKAVQQNVEEFPDAHVPEPSTSDEFGGAKPKVPRTQRGKGRGKGVGKGRGRGKKQPEVVPCVPVQSQDKSDMMTQTDSDFEEYLIMSEQDYEEYQIYKEKVLMQKYLVSTIREEDFEQYDAQ